MGNSFGSCVDAYAAGRPTYPPEALQVIRRTIDAPQVGSVLDLGAGHGALSIHLRNLGLPVVAVDISRAMLSHMPSGISRVLADAQKLPFSSGSASAVTAATAFHWFATDDTTREIHRVLMPECPLILCWNTADQSIEWVRKERALVERYAESVARYVSMQWQEVLHRHPGFSHVQDYEIPNPTPMDRHRLTQRLESTSFIATLDEMARAHLLDEVLGAVSDLPESFIYPYLTRIYVYCRK